MSNFTKIDNWRSPASNLQALKGIGQPSDVAGVNALVASEAARWITGVSVPVNGGSKL